MGFKNSILWGMSTRTKLCGLYTWVKQYSSMKISQLTLMWLEITKDPLLLLYLETWFFFCFLVTLWHMEFPDQGPDLSHSWDLHHRCGQVESFNPLCQARDWTGILVLQRRTGPVESQWELIFLGLFFLIERKSTILACTITIQFFVLLFLQFHVAINS